MNLIKMFHIHRAKILFGQGYPTIFIQPSPIWKIEMRPNIESDSQRLTMSGTQSLSPDIICLTFLSTLIGIWVLFVDIPVYIL